MTELDIINNKIKKIDKRLDVLAVLLIAFLLSALILTAFAINIKKNSSNVETRANANTINA